MRRSMTLSIQGVKYQKAQEDQNRNFQFYEKFRQNDESFAMQTHTYVQCFKTSHANFPSKVQSSLNFVNVLTSKAYF